MPIAKEAIDNLIMKAFPDAQIAITDLVGDQNHYELKILSSSFEGKSKIQQHRMVNEALKGYIGGDLHALSIKTGAFIDSQKQC